MLVLIALSLLAATPQTVERWRSFEIALRGPATGNPFVDVQVSATFTLANDHHVPTVLTVGGFYDDGGAYKVRFAPPLEGIWTYTTSSNARALNGHTGSLLAVKPSPTNHGPVLSHGFELRHADGTPHVSVGSTSYQWASMPKAMQAQTLQTLRHGQGDGRIFSKQRMTVFPKWYRNNHQNPVEVGAAFEIRPGSAAANASVWGCVGSKCPSVTGSFDLTRFNVSFWRNYEGLVAQMQEAGVVAVR